MPPHSVAAADPPGPRGALVFISYAHVDEVLRAGLRAHLSVLEREGLVHTWDDRQILAGDDFADAIDVRLNRADVILLLVSADFITSEYCYGKELERALERHADPADRAIVIPIILRRCDWQSTPFAKLQALPAGARPLAEWPSADDYYTAVTQGLRRRLQRLVDADSRWFERVGRRLRDPLWWQQPRVWAGALALAALATAAGIAWWSQARQVDAQVHAALQHLRSARYQDAFDEVGPACAGWVRRDACFVLAKVELGRQLERVDTLDPEKFAAALDRLRSRARDDPDLLLYAAQLALSQNRAALETQARADIARALELTQGRFPEAHFYLANLEMIAGRHADALPHLDRALDPQVNPAPPAQYLNARAYARARTGDLAGAIQDYERSAERGLVLSRIELAELLWSVSEFERASDQLQAATRALDADAGSLQARNALPWAFETAPAGAVVLLRQAQEKRCFARWMHRAGLVLAGRDEPADPPAWSDCGPEATRIASAVAAALARAAGAGMNDTGRERAAGFARRHRL